MASLMRNAELHREVLIITNQLRVSLKYFEGNFLVIIFKVKPEEPTNNTVLLWITSLNIPEDFLCLLNNLVDVSKNFITCFPLIILQLVFHLIKGHLKWTITNIRANRLEPLIADCFNENDENFSQKTKLINPCDAVCVHCMLMLQ